MLAKVIGTFFWMATVFATSLQRVENIGIESEIEPSLFFKGALDFQRIIDSRLRSFSSGSDELNKIMGNLRRSECVKNAIQEVIPTCIKHGIDGISLRIQKKVAVDLSICEFKNTGIHYPVICYNIHSSEEYDWCISELERTPQYWTTFSGYYRDVMHICQEESLPYEKEQILTLYTNITKVFKHMFYDVSGSHQDIKNSQKEINSTFEIISTLMKEFLKESELGKEYFKNQFDQFSGVFDELLSKSFNTTKEYSEMSNEAFRSTMNDIVSLEHELTKTADSLNRFDMDAKIDAITAQIMGDFEAIDQESSSLLNRILMRLREMDVITGNQEELFSGMQEKLQSSSDKIEQLNMKLDNANNKLALHSEGIISQFEQVMNKIEISGDAAIESAIKQTNEVAFEYISLYIQELTMKLDQTATKLDDILENINSISRKFSAVSEFFLRYINMFRSNSLSTYIRKLYFAMKHLSLEALNTLGAIPKNMQTCVAHITRGLTLFLLLYILKLDKIIHTCLGGVNILLSRTRKHIICKLEIWGSIFGGIVAAFLLINAFSYPRLDASSSPAEVGH